MDSCVYIVIALFGFSSLGPASVVRPHLSPSSLDATARRRVTVSILRSAQTVQAGSTGATAWTGIERVA